MPKEQISKHKKEEEYEAFRKRAVDAAGDDIKLRTFTGKTMPPADQARHNAGKFIIPGLEAQLPEHKERQDALLKEEEKIQQEIENLKQKLERLAKFSEAISRIPVLFDVPSFGAVEGHLWMLKSAGIEKIQIGDKEYTIADLQEIVAKAQRYVEEGEDRMMYDAYLKLAGVPQEKVSNFSAMSFRDCLLKCMQDYNPAVVRKPQ